MDVHSYVDGFIRRKRIRLKACEERRERALAAAKEAAAFLADAGATRVILFGSLARESGFGQHSDIDLAVEGISWSEYWSVWAAVDSLTDFAVDIVVLEDANPTLKERIRDEGVTLYDDGRHSPAAHLEGSNRK
ncbi:MAG: nucleotidyltransferase domain-containing protein [Bacillota bacterium]|jgi:predicted nucleotidyltransferase|nr:nucleotidyltransferase domain-containing protein [Bacillota bacterium]NLH87151.1 nucleotidyltransferase domain-containing protein [Bacillota bacterium]